MATNSHCRMSEYFDPRRSLKDRFDELSDPSAMPNYRDPKANEAIMGFVAKFLCDYLRVTETNVAGIRNIVRAKVRDLEENEMPRVSQSAMQGRPEGTSDVFGVQSLADVRATAGLFKEIAFNDRFETNEPSNFVGVDLGSGTGILGSAIAVAAVRNRMQKPLVALVDSQKNALDNSERVLSPVSNVNFKPLQVDLRSPELYRVFATPVWVRYWVSETFGETTPKITKLSPTELRWREGSDVSYAINGAVDPYMNVLENLMRYCPSFYDRVRQGKAAFFPDPINGNFLPDDGNGRILLKTGPEQKPVLFRDVQNEFTQFEDFSVSNIRWG